MAKKDYPNHRNPKDGKDKEGMGEKLKGKTNRTNPKSRGWQKWITPENQGSQTCGRNSKKTKKSRDQNCSYLVKWYSQKLTTSSELN